MRTLLIPIIVSSALSLAGGQALAHAQLEKASPPVGGTVSPPSQISLEFSEGVEPKFTKVLLTGPDGKPIPLGVSKVAGSEGSVLVTPIEKPLAPGAYKVHWRAVSVDSHHTQGDFSFTVK